MIQQYISLHSSLAHFKMQLMHFENTTDTKYYKAKCIRIRLGSNKNTGTKLGKDKKKNPRRSTEVGTFTTITHRKENMNKPGLAK